MPTHNQSAPKTKTEPTDKRPYKGATATTDATHHTLETATAVTRKVHSKGFAPTEWDWACVEATGKIQQFLPFAPFLFLINFIQWMLACI